MFIVEIDVIEVYGKIMSGVSPGKMVEECFMQIFPSIQIEEKTSKSEEDSPRDQPKHNSHSCKHASQSNPHTTGGIGHCCTRFTLG